ncbi:MAG: hypothetical protein ABI760_15200 [Ferruginibacter sp.]
MLITINAKASQPKITQSFAATDFTAPEYAAIKSAVGKYKTIPLQYEKQVLLALSYFPELLNTRIIFRVKHTYSPLSTRPAWTSVVIPPQFRTYIITISDSSMNLLTPILFNKMDFNAQVGVIGHELSHVADFSGKHVLGLLRVGAGNLSHKFLDRFEFKTDSICIDHGLGYQLLSWSIFVRKNLHHENYDGADNVRTPMLKERYMNPDTIRKRIGSLTMYRNVKMTQ